MDTCIPLDWCQIKSGQILALHKVCKDNVSNNYNLCIGMLVGNFLSELLV